MAVLVFWCFFSCSAFELYGPRAEAGGNKDKVKSLYIQHRVAELKEEQSRRVEQTKAESENQKNVESTSLKNSSPKARTIKNWNRRFFRFSTRFVFLFGGFFVLSLITALLPGVRMFTEWGLLFKAPILIFLYMLPCKIWSGKWTRNGIY